jgi:hypothetical protein
MARLFWTKGIDVVGMAGQFWIFAISADREMIYKYWDGANWQPSASGWNSLGANFVSPPSVAGRGDPGTVQIDVVGVGVTRNRFGQTSTAVLHKFWNGSAWQPASAWDNLGEITLQDPASNWTAPVAITGTGPNRLDVVAIDASGQVYHRYLASGAWQPAAGWELLGAGVRGAPAIAGVGRPPLRFNVFAAGTPPPYNILHQYWNNSSWQPSQTTWESMGGAASETAPEAFGGVVAAGMNSDTQFDVFGFSADASAIWQKSFYLADPSSWHPLQQWNAMNLTGFPAAVESGTPFNRVDLFVTDDRVLHCSKPVGPGGGFSAVEDIGGGLPASIWVPAAAADCIYPAFGTGQIHVAYINQDGMQHKYYDGSNWQPSQTGWNPIGNGLNNNGFSWPGN